jgi:L-asparaginase type II
VTGENQYRTPNTEYRSFPFQHDANAIPYQPSGEVSFTRMNVRRFPWVVLAIGALASSAVAQPQPAAAASPLPKVRVIATGGTIAGEQDQPGTLGAYRSGARSVEQIVSSVPELARFAQIETEQFANTASTNITPEQWLGLSRRINQLFKEQPDLSGVVVTHGTDRLEETAFFLYLTVKSDRPVVVVGAQRPATGISPDGPINLLSAVRTAGSPAARGMGVMVVMDDRILSARENRKIYPRNGGFSTGEMGMLGVVAQHGPEFFFAPVRRRGEQTEFDVANVDKLPQVDLTFSYPGGAGYRMSDGARGLVVATTGMAPSERESFDAIRKSGVIVVTTFPSGDHVASPGRFAGGGGAPGQGQPMISAQHLLPSKCRILLMLALTKTSDAREIQRMFSEY